MADNYRMSLPAERILLVHAHPDDETIGNGATMAAYRARGAGVTLVTCTRGEEGEVLVPALAHLAASQNDELGEYRVGELSRAMLHLGVTDHLFLGAPHNRYRDSGMMGTAPNERSDSFWQADADQVTAQLVEIIRDRKPQVLITYDENGGYGHPDHIKAHRIAMRAAELAADPEFGSGDAWEISKIYWNAIPRSAIKKALTSKKSIQKFALKFFRYVPSRWLTLPFVQADSVVTTAIDGNAHLPAKLAALSEHKTQLVMDADLFEFSKGMAIRVSGTEHYILAKGRRGQGDGKSGWESDLFSGLDS
jgi:N-acetyl-1-D-myo-inositol-2-amino-2-deoxy-alpha-D-glucopyranoside deacetylase